MQNLQMPENLNVLRINHHCLKLGEGSSVGKDVTLELKCCTFQCPKGYKWMIKM